MLTPALATTYRRLAMGDEVILASLFSGRPGEIGCAR